MTAEDLFFVALEDVLITCMHDLSLLEYAHRDG